MNIWLSTQNYFSDRLPDGESFAYSKTFQTWFLFPKPRTQALLAFIPGSIGFIGLSHFSLHPVPREKKQNCEKKPFFLRISLTKTFDGRRKYASVEVHVSPLENWTGIEAFLPDWNQRSSDKGLKYQCWKRFVLKIPKFPKFNISNKGFRCQYWKRSVRKIWDSKLKRNARPLAFVQYRDHHELLHCGTGAT